MSQYDIDLKYAHDVLNVMKRIDSTDIADDINDITRHLSTTRRYRQKLIYYRTLMIAASSGSTHYKLTAINASEIDEINVLHYRLCDRSLYQLTVQDGIDGIDYIESDDIVLTSTEEQYFQNSLIYDEANVLKLLIYSVINEYKFNSNYIRLSLDHLELLKYKD